MVCSLTTYPVNIAILDGTVPVLLYAGNWYRYLCRTVLSGVKCAKYLGVSITNDLQWSNNI